MDTVDERGGNASYLQGTQGAAAGVDLVQKLAKGEAPGSEGVEVLAQDLEADETKLYNGGVSKVENLEDGEVFEEANNVIDEEQKHWQSLQSENKHADFVADNGDGVATVNEKNHDPCLAQDLEADEIKLDNSGARKVDDLDNGEVFKEENDVIDKQQKHLQSVQTENGHANFVDDSGDGVATVNNKDQVPCLVPDPEADEIKLDNSGASKVEDLDDGEVYEEANDVIDEQEKHWQSEQAENDHAHFVADNGDGVVTVDEKNHGPCLDQDLEADEIKLDNITGVSKAGVMDDSEVIEEANTAIDEQQHWQNMQAENDHANVVADTDDGVATVNKKNQDPCLVQDLEADEIMLDNSGASKVEDLDDGEVFEEANTVIDEHDIHWQSVQGENKHANFVADNGDDAATVNMKDQDLCLTHAALEVHEEDDKFDEAKDVQREDSPYSDTEGESFKVSNAVQGEDRRGLTCASENEIDGETASNVSGIEDCTTFPVNDELAQPEIEKVKEENQCFEAKGVPPDVNEKGVAVRKVSVFSHNEMHNALDDSNEKVASFDKDLDQHDDKIDSLEVILEKDDAALTASCETSEVKSHFPAEREEQNQKDGREHFVSSQVQEPKPASMTLENLGEKPTPNGNDNSTSVKPEPIASSLPKKSSGPSMPTRPAGLGSSAPLPEIGSRSSQPIRTNGSSPLSQTRILDDSAHGDAEESDETREKLQMIRVKFLRLAYRLGQTPHNVVVAQVLYRLGLAEQLRSSRNTNRAGAFSFDRASAMAEHLEASGEEALDFSCTIMVIGKTGVGKSATINSIFDEVKFSTNAFLPGTRKVQDIVGTVQGIKVRVIDTPGLSSSSSDQRKNEEILNSVKRFIKKSPPDIVLYLDRLDMQSRDFGDVPLLRTITDIFGASIWFNAIVVLTHAASAPPDGTNGTPMSYEMFVTQRSHVVQQAIRQAAGDMRLMNPVSLVENHSACRMNRAGQRVLPNGQVWKPQLLLLSFASKILAEANELLKLQDNLPGKVFGARARVPPLPFLLSSLLQSRPQLKLPEEQLGDDDSMGEDLDDASDSGDESDYDELPSFKCLTRAQIAKLSREQKKAYFDELDYREKLFYKKQLKEERRRKRFLKKMASAAKESPDGYNDENPEDESGVPASVPVPMADLVLPASFDSDYPSHRYRFLDSSSQWVVRPVLETQGWDHDVGYEGLNVERMFVVREKVPLSVSGQLTKDKKECTLQMEMASSIKHGKGKATSLGLDMQTVGKDMAYTLRGDTRFDNFSCNNTAAGVSVTLLGDSLSGGLKVEDKLILNKRLRMMMNGGAMTGRGDVAYGGRLEVVLRDKDFPLVQALTTLALSAVDWHGDLALGCNLQSQLPVGRHTNLTAHANLNNRGTGQVGIRINSSEQLQIAMVALFPILKHIQRMFSSQSA